MTDPGVRLIIVPGLHDSGPTHWQSWLQARSPGALRVQQRNWAEPSLDAWADQVSAAVDAARGKPCVAVAHSFGCLALVRHLQQHIDSPVRAALLVAPADPLRFGLEDALPDHRLGVDSTWVASTNDPWMSLESSDRWARRWGCRWLNLGAVGHINAEAGFGPLPLAARWVRAQGQRLQRSRRPAHAAFNEWSFSV